MSGQTCMRTLQKRREQEGFAALAARFRMVGAIEKMHEERYRELLRDVQAQAVFEKSSVKVWERPELRAYLVVGTSAPKGLSCLSLSTGVL